MINSRSPISSLSLAHEALSQVGEFLHEADMPELSEKIGKALALIEERLVAQIDHGEKTASTRLPTSSV